MVYTFDEFRLDSTKRKLLRGGAEVKLSDNEFDLLFYLIEERPNFCSLDQIIKRVWRDTSVEYNSVEKAVVNLRKALSDNARAPFFIRNRRGRGYAFIRDVQENECLTPRTEEAVSAQPRNFEDHYRVRLGTGAITFVALVSLMLCVGFLFWKGDAVGARMSQRTILHDDFGGKELDPAVWTMIGNGVKVDNGVVKVACWETDNCGRLVSQFVIFDPDKPITIETSMKINPSKNLKNKSYFLSFFGLTPKIANVEDRDTRDKSIFGVYYVDYDYESKYPNGEIDEFAAEGWFLFRNGGSPQKKVDYSAGKIGGRISPLWDTWFAQRITYDPGRGRLTYFVDDKLLDVFQAGNLYKNIAENKVRIEVAPRGWWVNHSIEIDDIKVYQ